MRQADSIEIMVSHYSTAAEFYDLLYRGEKDYATEAELLRGVIHGHNPAATSVLDVACGTGDRGRIAAAGLAVERKPEVLRTRGLYVGHVGA
jgi:ubiquinone/menaquinone biosynthesis C-methylase UbiE